MRGFGGMVSFELRPGVAAAQTASPRARSFTLAESLGGVESLVEDAASMTHASIPPESAAPPGSPTAGAPVGGIEHVDDLLRDIEAAPRRSRR
jgi:cystathionine gamma-lyase